MHKHKSTRPRPTQPTGPTALLLFCFPVHSLCVDYTRIGASNLRDDAMHHTCRNSGRDENNEQRG
jgi:hypothetical protein